jgi:hypothetical protein
MPHEKQQQKRHGKQQQHVRQQQRHCEKPHDEQHENDREQRI